MQINSYSAALDQFNRARSKKAGRPLNGGRLRLHSCPLEDGIRMDYDGIPVCVFTPENTLSFVLPNDKLPRISASLSQMIGRATPIGLSRKRQDVYELWVTPKHNWTYTDWRAATKYIYHDSIKFDLNTMACLNPKADPKDTVIPEVRRTWLAHLREFRKQVLVRQKLGVLDSVIRTECGSRKHVSDSVVIDTLIEALRSKTVTTEQLATLVQYVRSVHYWFGAPPDSNTVAMWIVSLCTGKHSFKLRQQFGVFGGE